MQSSNSAAIFAENANVMIVHFIFTRSFVMFDSAQTSTA